MDIPPYAIIDMALKKYNPVKVLLLFSGGHDSLCSSHYAARYFQKLNIPFIVYHGNTGIFIPQTREFVKNVCKKFNWELFIGNPKPGETYRDIVEKYGFPGPTKSSHQYMYRRLKERALRHYVTHSCKSRPYARENVLLISGVRRSESKIRMGYTDPVQKDDSRIWCNPFFFMDDEQQANYMKVYRLPRNPVKDTICISGECLCGAFAKKEEWKEIQLHYPEVAAQINELHELAKANGHPWHWASGPNEWKKEQKAAKNFMCVGCEEKRTVING